ncbi:MAG: hypothetical protein AAF911_01780 [Planctomycetota bacterium]
MTRAVIPDGRLCPEARLAMAWKYPLLDRIAAGADRDRWLTDHPSVERALGVAWDTADPRGRRRIMANLLQRRRPEGLVVLVQRLHELDPGSRAELAQRVDQLQKPLRLVLSGGAYAQDPEAQINALVLIEAAAAGSLAYLVTEKLRSPHDRVRQRAAASLLGMVSRVDQLGEVDGHRLTAAINDAVVRYGRHERPAVLQAWLGLAPRGLVAGGAALEALQDPDHAAVGPMRERLSTPESDHDRAGLVACLAIPTLTLAAVAGLRYCIEHHTWGSALAGREHLLDWSAVRRGLARAGEPQHLLPASWDTQTEAAVTALPAWSAALPMSPLDQTIRLGHLTTDDTPLPARFAATRRLIEQANSATADPGSAPDPRVLAEVQHQLLGRADDENAALAQLAASWLLQRATDLGAGDEILATLSRSRHESVRRRASRRLAATAFDRLWQAWPGLKTKAKLAAARTALKVDPLAHRRLETQLKRGGSHRTRALEIVTCLPSQERTAEPFAGEAA